MVVSYTKSETLEDPSAEWRSSAPVDWANESLAITLAPKTRYVGASSGFSLGPTYVTNNLPIVKRRLQQAGVRLAKLLSDELD
jgi:hypothetical protein